MSNKNQENYKFKDSSVSKNLIEIVENIDELTKNRNSILQRHAYEILNYNIEDLEDREARINRIIGKDLTYPNSFLASSLGFNRNTWNKKYENILSKFGLTRKLKEQTLRNMLSYEKLKYLIMKYYEVSKK